jgi:hypothetical protein
MPCVLKSLDGYGWNVRREVADPFVMDFVRPMPVDQAFNGGLDDDVP